MSREELIDAYAEGRIGRREFMKRMALVGGALGAVLVRADAAAAAHSVEHPNPKKTGAGKKAAKKAGGKPTL